jgi:hypothetical protein
VDKIPLLHHNPLYTDKPIDQPIQALKHVDPNMVHYEKVNGEEDHADYHDDRGLLHVVARRKRRFVEFGTSFPNKLAYSVFPFLIDGVNSF